MNKDTERGCLAYSHNLRLLSQFNHWSTKAIESNALKLLTLRVLRQAGTLPGLELKHLPKPTHDNEIAATLWAASQAVDHARQQSRHTIQCRIGNKDNDKNIRQQCKPLHYSNKILKHLAPLWESREHNWQHILTIQYASPDLFIYNIQPT